jgi:RNA polymerase sigma factor (TIGR02999 family)
MPLTPDETVQIVLDAARTDEPLDRLMGPIYAELRAVAVACSRGEDASTLQATALVNEAYLKLAGGGGYSSPEHVLAVAAKAMRQVIIDHARARSAAKRGGGRRPMELRDDDVRHEPALIEALQLEEALARLESLDERVARVVELKFFGGLTNSEVASVLGIARTTVAADWRHARAWLRAELAATDPA